MSQTHTPRPRHPASTTPRHTRTPSAPARITRPRPAVTHWAYTLATNQRSPAPPRRVPQQLKTLGHSQAPHTRPALVWAVPARFLARPSEFQGVCTERIPFDLPTRPAGRTPRPAHRGHKPTPCARLKPTNPKTPPPASAPKGTH